MYGDDSQRRLKKLEAEKQELESDIEYQREQARRREDDLRIREDQDRNERRRSMAQAMCEADDWEDAWSKGISRYENEARLEESLNADPAIAEQGIPQTTFFIDALPKLMAAKAIFDVHIADARKQAEEIMRTARDAAAAEIEAKGLDVSGLADAIREDDYSVLVNW